MKKDESIKNVTPHFEAQIRELELRYSQQNNEEKKKEKKKKHSYLYPSSIIYYSYVDRKVVCFE